MVSSSRDVFLFVPNLIGYGRVVLLAASFAFAVSRPAVFLALYWCSFLLDAADGHAARLLDQASRFGALLDMVTDRVATNALVIVLSHLYPSHLPWFLALCCLDLSSHWIRMYASFVSGSSSHKNASAERDGIIVTVYYTNRLVLASVCLLNELFYVALYCMHHFPHFVWIRWVVIGSAPIFLLKQYINVIQLLNSSIIVAEADVAARKLK